MKIAVSACLLGEPCRYDGASKPCAAAIALRGRHEIVAVCPECAGDLPTPRVPSEVVRRGNDLRVFAADGADNTEAFLAGAHRELARAQEAGCTLAVLKAKSPSCGSGRICDGTFSGTLADGWGIAAALFRDAGIRVIDETQIEHIEGL